MNRRILVVEDDVWLGEYILRSLRGDGHKTHHVRHALEAMDIIDEYEPHAIVLDMLLPAATGLALLHEMQSYSDLSRIPVVLVSNLASEMIESDLRPYGVHRLVDKTTMVPGDVAVAVRSVL